MMSKTILLSIHPQWAEAILNGTKKWEYRRISPKLCEGFRVVLYASGKSHAIVGEFIVEKLLKEPLNKLIEHTLHETPHDKKGFWSYFSSLKIGSALKVSYPIAYQNPIPLNEIRKIIPEFIPPQNFIYLTEDNPKTKKILDILPAASSISNQKDLSGY